MERQLAGRTALVTGGARGIGAGIVRRLVTSGAQVAFTFVRAQDQADELVDVVAAAGGRALAVRADSGDPVAVRAAIGRTVDAFGGLDILVNNSADLRYLPFADVSVDHLARAMAVTLTGAFVAIQEAVRHMGEGGRVINIGSVFADRTPATGNGNGAVYQMTKAGIAGLTRGLARELGPHGITINNVQPGVVETDAVPDGTRETMVELTPVGRAGQPADIAGIVAYLASPEAGFVNGATWNIDGGFAV